MFAGGWKSIFWVKFFFAVWFCNNLYAMEIDNRQSIVLLNFLTENKCYQQNKK